MASERRIPSLRRPRLRRGRGGDLVASTPAEREAPRVEEIAAEGLRWVKIDHPSALEQAWLEEHFDFHALDFEDVLSRNQRPKIDVYDEYLFIVLHFPIFDRTVGRLGTGELDLFVGPGFLISIPNQPLQPVEYLFERCRQKEELRDKLFARGSGYLLYRIVDDGFDYCFPMLRKIGNKLDSLEEEIFEGRSEEVVRDISNAKQEIINFRKVIRPQRPVLRDLEGVKQRYLAPEIDLEIYFDDIVDAHERIWDMLENYKEVVEALEDTNESVLSHRVNDVLRVLTSISVIVLPLTLIASVFGMNVGLPGGGDPPAGPTVSFWVVLGVMLALLAGMVAYFRRRRWL
jgi:magnesium transporter